MLDHAAGTGTHTFAARGKADSYETPECAVRALLDVEEIPYRVWEPACGSGNIVRVLRTAGHEVFASDLYDYGFGEPGVDFLVRNFRSDFTGAIVTNPPYQHAQKFVEKAIKVAPLVIMLLRLQFLESKRRSGILDEKLSRVHVFKNRLPMMHRTGWDGPKASSAMAFAWFVWDKEHRGPTTLDRISWE